MFYSSWVEPKNRIQTVVQFDEEPCRCTLKCLACCCCPIACCLWPIILYAVINNETCSRIAFKDKTKTCQRCGSNRKITEEDIHNYKVQLSEHPCLCCCPDSGLQYINNKVQPSRLGWFTGFKISLGNISDVGFSWKLIKTTTLSGLF